MKDLWNNNEVQFARIINELELLGVFQTDILAKLELEMDLDVMDIIDILNRASDVMDKVKSEI